MRNIAKKNLIIDLVCLWVDSADSVWQEKRKKYSLNTENQDKDAIADFRFINNNELKYSLRSVEKFAPWINKIFIVTDNQVPDWLNINHPKIRVVDHKEIIPEEKLPLFNSCAIESRIPFINDLSEYFLYANDDTFFWEPLNPEFFFKNEKPILRFNRRIKMNRKNKKRLYAYTINRTYEIISKKYKIPISPHFPHHNINAYRKSFFLECIKEFDSEFNETLNHRFRDFSDMQRTGIAFYMLAKKAGIPKFVAQTWFGKHLFKTIADSRCFGINPSNLIRIEQAKTRLLCINDTREAVFDDRLKVKKILETKFPDKSGFEK